MPLSILLSHRLIRRSGRNGSFDEPLTSQDARPFVKSNPAKHHTQSNFSESPGLERPERTIMKETYEYTITTLAQRTRHFPIAGSRTSRTPVPRPLPIH